MKLERSNRTASSPSGAVSPRGGAALAPVARADGSDNERERSLQQELDTVEALAVGDFQGGERVMEQAHELARRIVAEGAPGLVVQNAAKALTHVDEQV